MAKIESKLEGVNEQIQADIQHGLEAGMLNVQKEMERMFAGMMLRCLTLLMGNPSSR